MRTYKTLDQLEVVFGKGRWNQYKVAKGNISQAHNETKSVHYSNIQNKKCRQRQSKTTELSS